MSVNKRGNSKEVYKEVYKNGMFQTGSILHIPRNVYDYDSRYRLKMANSELCKQQYK